MSKLNPLKLIIIWLGLMVTLSIILILGSAGSGGGEQKPLTILATITISTLIGIAVISVTAPFLFRNWFKQNKSFGVFMILALIPTTFFSWNYISSSHYSYVESSRQIDGIPYDIRKEYYDNENKTIRSVSIWKNGKKDSIWSTFSKDGSIMKQKVYRNDTLISQQ